MPPGLLRRVFVCGLGLLAGPAAAQQGPAVPAVRLSGYLQARETWQERVGLAATINRARLAASGPVGRGFSWRLQGEFRTGNVGNGKASVSLQDAYVRWTRDGLGIQAGQFKTPFAREFVTPLADLETPDRATVVDSLAPKRDIGVMVDYDHHQRVQLLAGVFNGEGINTTANRDSTLLGVIRAVARLHRRVTLGANVARYFGDSTRFGADVNYEGPRLTLRAEALAQARDSMGGARDRGWLVLAAVKLRDDVQVVAKYEDFERPALGPAQDNRAWTGAVNVLLAGTAVRLTGAYINREVGNAGATGTVLAQLQVRF